MPTEKKTTKTGKERAQELLAGTVSGPVTYQSAVTIVYEWLRTEDVPPGVVYTLHRVLENADAERFVKRVERMRHERGFATALDFSGFY